MFVTSPDVVGCQGVSIPWKRHPAEVSNDDALPRLYARLSARAGAGRTLLANRIATTASLYAAGGRCSRLISAASDTHELSRFNYVRWIFPACALGASNVSFRISHGLRRGGRGEQAFWQFIAPCYWACAGRALV